MIIQQIVENYCDLDERITVIKTNISQLNFNLNIGEPHARGKFIARIDCDDLCLEHRLEKQLVALNSYDVVGSNIELICENSSKIGVKKFPESDRKIRNSIWYKSVMAHPSLIMSKNLLLEVGGYQGGRYAQDYDLLLRLMRDQKIKFYNIQESLVKYRIHSNQSKGLKESYSHVAGYLFRESIYMRRFKYLAGAFIYACKSVFK